MYIHNEHNELSLVAQLVERQTRTLESVCVFELRPRQLSLLSALNVYTYFFLSCVRVSTVL